MSKTICLLMIIGISAVNLLAQTNYKVDSIENIEDAIKRGLFSGENPVEQDEDSIMLEKKKRDCGKNYMKLEIGMPFSILKKCAGNCEFRLISQVNTPKGVLSAYECNEDGVVHVIGGKVVYWASYQ